MVPKAPTPTAFTGVNRVESPVTYASRALSAPEQGLEAKATPRVKDWTERHESQKQQISTGNTKDVKLIIGDSIIRHMDKAPAMSKEEEGELD